MTNLDQLRAANALTAAELPGRDQRPKLIDKSSVAKLPGMILTNGLLATLAFACEEGKENRRAIYTAAYTAANALAIHLGSTFVELNGCNSGTVLGNRLAGGNALTLQRATTESLAYLSYLKRFAEKKPDRAPV